MAKHSGMMSKKPAVGAGKVHKKTPYELAVGTVKRATTQLNTANRRVAERRAALAEAEKHLSTFKK